MAEMLCDHEWRLSRSILINKWNSKFPVYRCTKCNIERRYYKGTWEYFVNGKWMADDR